MLTKWSQNFQKKLNWKRPLPGWGKKTHTHKRNIAKAKKRKWLELSTPASDVCLNSGRPSENQALQECYIFTNLALVKE